MPWEIVTKDGKHCVVKKGTDEVEGCHETPEEAKDQMAALYANEEKAVWTSTADLPDSCFLFVESGEKDAEGKTTPRSLRHLPYKNASGEVDLPHLRNAISRANQVKLKDGSTISESKANAIKAKAQKILDQHKSYDEGELELNTLFVTNFDEWDQAKEVAELHAGVQSLNTAMSTIVNNIIWAGDIKDKAAAIKKAADGYEERMRSITTKKKTLTDKVKEFLGFKPDFSVFKDASGTWRFEGTYSNADQDRDRETLMPEAHKAFAGMVNCQAVPYPVLLAWHVKGVPMGQADSISYNEEAHTAHVSGYWLPEFYPVAETVSQLKDLGMSHGMPRDLIERNPDNPAQIVRYVSSEVSFLPKWAAANLGTNFTVREDTMLKEDQVKFLKELGLSDDYIQRLPLTKEADTAVEKEAETEEPKVEEKEVVAPPPDSGQQEIIEAIKGLAEVVGQIGLALKSTNDRLDGLEKTETERLKTVVADTPAMSLKDMIMASIVGKDQVAVDGRNSLMKSAPVEKKAVGQTGIPVIDTMIAGGDWRTAVEAPKQDG